MGRKKDNADLTSSPIRRELKENPSSTAKFDAYVGQRRACMEEKKAKEELKFEEEVGRFIKQNRLQQRVKCSPAIVNNAADLRKRKSMSQKRAKDSMRHLEKSWD